MGRTSFVSIRNSDTHAKGAPRLLGLGLLLAVLFVANFASAQTSENSEPTIGYAAQAKALMVQDPDSALVLALLAEGQLEQVSGIAQRVDVLLVLGDAQLTAEDMPAAMHAFQRAQLLVEEALEADGPDPELALSLSDVHVKVGVLHFHMREYEKSIARYNEALQVLEGVYDSFSKEELALRKVRLFNNIAGVYIQRSDFDTALRYYQQAIAMNEPLKDLRNEGTLNNNVGICQMELGRHDLAALYFLKALAVRKELGDARGQAQVLNNLGKNQALVGHFGAARQHFEQALELGRELGSRESMVISLESLSSVYDTLGEYKTALLTYKEFKALNDSLYSVESKATIARLEESFRREKEKKVFELEAKRKDAENARQRLWNIALAGALFFVLLTAFLLFKVMRARVRNSTLEQEKLRLEGEKLEAEQTTLRESLEYKDRELTANALFLLKKNELISHIAERLLKAKSTFKQENQQIIQDIVRDLQSSQDEHNWAEFEAHFTRVHSTFYQSLQERFPSLTPNERKLCAFLRLNMSTKDISAITQQSLNSITVARSRLRKKLQIEGEDVHLIDFLLSI